MPMTLLDTQIQKHMNEEADTSPKIEEFGHRSLEEFRLMDISLVYNPLPGLVLISVRSKKAIPLPNLTEKLFAENTTHPQPSEH